MWIQVRTMDGKKSFQLDGLSKLTKIEDLRLKMKDQLEVPPSKQRLFFAGKQLEDGHTLFDYNIGLNSLIQVMIRIDTPDETPSGFTKLEENLCLNNDSVKLEEKKSTFNTSNLRWKVSELIDGKDVTMGAWFEGKIEKISFDENNEVLYHVTFDGYDENELVPLSEINIRPRARTKVPFEELQPGMIVMANYNFDSPKERGFWYDVTVTKKINKRNSKEFIGTVQLSSDKTTLEECKCIFTDEIFKIESSDSPLECNDKNTPELRKNKPDCDTCKDNPNIKCKECGCHKCSGKDEPEKTLMCDECDMAYHMKCLDPPLITLPEEDEWYCPECKNDGSNVIKAGQKLKESSKKAKMASANSKTNRDWGKGMACVGRTKICTIVPSNHFGPIPGVPVGSCWKFRVQASEAGVHRPHVSGMHGRDSEGAYSIVLAGGYEDDTDEGDEFTYTGSGGRDLSGNKRTAEQSFDQKLTKTNRALAKNCDCPVNDKKGGEAVNWKEGKPIRVIRSYKFAKHSKFAPEEGIRYDGIYKVVKYWPEKGQSGFIVWRYRLRRDDDSPAPWTKKGKEYIKKMNLEIQYPEGYLEGQAKKEAEKLNSKVEKNAKRKLNDSQEQDDSSDSNSTKSSPKKLKTAYKVETEFLTLIKDDSKNKKIWDELIEKPESHQKFLQSVEDRFVCICCQEVVYQPITIDCGHNTCKPCLQRAFKAGIHSCPSCRFELGNNFSMSINVSLSNALKKLFPGYDAAR
ncbi:E3 ubiquitin-protein ligase UHRF1 isoform X1 [Hydra vulgaris]|uniref:RING-type E3 ubiquitin transferase n=1 Tax=Hydra vulgaris TaxID=6087 RepID=T2M6C9_HYDVU|nr:E3 ubiquitin-protein ligase UHRF1-like [Hydra vulgaris]XP_047126276.1 E3 ubiquitin-protein ligase UHRF1-like [Hydra vulgaris]